LSSTTVGRIALAAALALAVIGVLVRAAIFIRYGPAFFDSDQAIVGLMAKHLSEGRGFPLFFYGQNYMLGVEAWMAAPCFWIGGATVAMLRTPLVLINVAVAVTTILIFVRRGVGPWPALALSLPLVATTPLVSAELMTTLGASIEPLLYVYVLWALRRRAAIFAAVFAIACLHREFVVLTLPAIVLALWLERRVWRGRQWAIAAAVAAAVWVAIDILKWHTPTLGPASGPPIAGAGDTSSLVDEARVIGGWLSIEWSGYAARVWSLIANGLPDFFGAHRYPLADVSLDDALTAGSVWAGAALAAACGLGAVRLIQALARTRTADPGLHREDVRSRLALPVYLGAIAVETILVYGLNVGIDPRAEFVARYVLFVLFAPVALLGAWLLVERSRAWRTAGASLVAVWALLTIGDNVRWLAKLAVTPRPSEFRELATDLISHGVHYGRAQYWDAYVVTFLSRERVILASTDKVRIGEYQTIVDAHAADAVTIVRVPCDTGRRVASWCIVPPPR
jgi:hypothetical protein